MPTNTLITPSVVRVAEDVEDKIYNFNPSDAPLLSMIERTGVSNVFHEWNRDSYRTPDGTRAAIEGADASYAAQTQPTPLNNRTQIFQDTVSVSNTAERVKKYGRKNEAAALLSWSYNVGVGAACRSTLIRKLNAGQPWCGELHRWVYAGGEKLRGLVKRRAAEYEVCTA